MTGKEVVSLCKEKWDKAVEATKHKIYINKSRKS